MLPSSIARHGEPLDPRELRIPFPVEDDRGSPLHVGDRVRFGPFQLTVVGVPARGEFAADVPPARVGTGGGALLARSASGEIFRFDAPTLHLHRVATRSLVLAL